MGCNLRRVAGGIVTLPSTVHHHAHFRVWQRKFYDMNIWSPKKRDEKLIYMLGVREKLDENGFTVHKLPNGDSIVAVRHD